MANFHTLLTEWKTAALRASAKEEAYRLAHAKAYVASQSKTGEARKADADAATSTERQHRDIADIEAQAARLLVDHELRRTGPAVAA